jgi:hypothetical protein
MAQLMVLLLFFYIKVSKLPSSANLNYPTLCEVPRDTRYQSSAALRSSRKNFNLAGSKLIASTVALPSR